MRAFTVISTLVAVAVSGVLANQATSPVPVFARQSSLIPDIPTECQASCKSIEKMTACGADLTCMCTKDMAQALIDCGSCGIKYYEKNPTGTVDIASVKAQLESSVNAFASSCKTAGHDIGTFSLSSSSSGGSGSTTGSGSSSGSANGAASTRAMAGAGALGLAVVMAAVL